MQDMLTYDAASGCLNIPCLRQAGAWWRSWRQRTCGLTPSCQTCSSGWSSTSCPSAGGCCSKVADLQRRHMQTHLCVPLFACFAIRLCKTPGVCDLRWEVQHCANWRCVSHLGNVVCCMAGVHHHPHLHHRFGRMPVQCEASPSLSCITSCVLSYMSWTVCFFAALSYQWRAADEV